MHDEDFLKFCEQWQGKPYLQGSSSLDDGGIDCFGIIYEWAQYKGIAVPQPVDRLNIGYAGMEYLRHLTPCDKRDAEIFACYKGGNMVHCGIISSNKCLHAVGKGDRGSVHIWPLSRLIRHYETVEYYQWRT